VARTSRTRELIESNLGQHIALAVAAHLARTQLVRDPLALYDGQHLADTVHTVACALARVAPLYVREAKSAEPRELTAPELEGALVEPSATSLVLRDGRRFGSVSVKRGELREAIAMLKATGVPGLAAYRPERLPGAMPKPRDRLAEIAGAMAELEELLRAPLPVAHAERAGRIAVSIARAAPHGLIANRAMQLVSALHEPRDDAQSAALQLALARLRLALEEVRAAC
jgi:hypothetical protein